MKAQYLLAALAGVSTTIAAPSSCRSERKGHKKWHSKTSSAVKSIETVPDQVNPETKSIENKSVQTKALEAENPVPTSASAGTIKPVETIAPVAVKAEQPQSERPIEVKSIGNFQAEYLGISKASNSCSHRDLGFTGQLGGEWYAVWGDALWCDAGVTDPERDNEGFHGMARNAISRMGDDPMLVEDLYLNNDQPVRHQEQFIKPDSRFGETTFYPFGVSSICETDSTTATGAIYILVNSETKTFGAGVAKVELVDGVPAITERFGDNGYWWDGVLSPRYGDVTAYRDVNSDYIYLLGGSPNAATDSSFNNIYQARVRAADAFNFEAYEYWWGVEAGWKSDLLTQFDDTTAIMFSVGQGQMVYNPYLNAYVFTHLNPGGVDVFLKTAPSPEGPWDEGTKVYETTRISNGLAYAGVAHPYLDESGKTLTVSWTNFNFHEVLKVTFE